MRNEFTRGTKVWVPRPKVSMDQIVPENGEYSKLGCWNLLKMLQRGQVAVRLGEKKKKFRSWQVETTLLSFDKAVRIC